MVIPIGREVGGGGSSSHGGPVAVAETGVYRVTLLPAGARYPRHFSPSCPRTKHGSSPCSNLPRPPCSAYDTAGPGPWVSVICTAIHTLYGA